MTPFGKYIRRLRGEHNVTLKDLSQKIGVKPPYLSALELGKKKGKPNDKTVEAISEFFNLDQDRKRLLVKAAEVSGHVITIPHGADPIVYEVAHLFIPKISAASAEQLKNFKNVLNLLDAPKPNPMNCTNASTAQIRQETTKEGSL